MKKTLIVTQHPSLGGGTESIRNKIIKEDVDFHYEVDSPLKIVKHILDRKVSRQYNKYLHIGGVSLGAISFLKSRVHYSLWLGSTVLDEWKTLKPNIKDNGFLRTVLYYFNTLTMPITLKIEKEIFKCADNIYAQSNYTKEKIEKILNDNNAYVPNIEVIHPPLKFSKTKIFYKKDNYMVFVGRIDKRKNLEMLVRAMNLMPKERLILVGRGNHSSLEKLQKYNNITYAGEISETEKIKLIQHAQAMIITSNQEGFCISVAEAMMYGCPVISTRCGGVEDMIEDGVNGYLVQRNIVSDLIYKIELMKKSFKKRNEFINISQKKIKKMCSYKNTIGKIIEPTEEEY